MQEIECNIVGKVQMVMFRDFILRNARTLGIRGTVENLYDGSVKVIAQGSEDNLNKFIEYLHKGPFLARVIRVNIEWRELTSDFSCFTIQY